GKQCALPSVLSLDKALHWRPPLILNPSNHSKDDANVFTRSGPTSARFTRGTQRRSGHPIQKNLNHTLPQ
ncbi:hypothetical protein KW867_30195, partial [Pseudomonas aeruginosa]|uniref:hypothetical protein n=1 Tax=Pseudomonas aeruginosa TaxID=287 RepID=UPI001B36CE2A